MKTNDILKITHAHKYYNRGKSNELHVMNDIDLALPSSGMIAIFGQSGCGKTTLLNAVGGLDSIAEGSIELFGENLARNTDVLRNKYVGYIFQNYNLNVGETVFENVADALRLCGMTDAEEIRTRVLAALTNVGMDKFKSRTPDTLSGGQQQRVAIARALVKSPAVLLADEPTGNLDEANTVLVMDILKELSRTRLVLLVTHEANLVDFYCDRVIRLVDGCVAEDRLNEDANGYIARDKNDIYLGELEKTEETLHGVTLTRYGTPEVPVKLRLVTSGGHTYLVCDSPEVRVLDESSEIRLREGVFRTVGHAEEDESKKQYTANALDLSALTPFEGSRFGRLFGWKNALSSAWSDNFAKKRKKGTTLLRLTLALLAVVIVFTTAISAVSVRSLTEVNKENNRSLFYVKLDKDRDYPGLNEYPASSGIDRTWLTLSRIPDTENVSFATAAFMTAASPTIEGEACFAPVTLLNNPEIVAGTAELKKLHDVLITTAFGDVLIESSTASYIDSYDDLVGLRQQNVWGDSVPCRIVGVVRSDEKLILSNPLSFAERILSDVVSLTTFNGLYARSKQTVYKEPIKKGELIVLNGLFEKGETVRLFGRDFLVAYTDHSASFSRLSDYLRYYTDKTGLTVSDYADYAGTGDPNVPEYRKYCEWVYEVFPQDGAFRDFCRMLVDRYLPWEDTEMSIDLWTYAATGDVTAYLSLLSALNEQPTGFVGTYATMPLGDVNQTYACYKYHEKTGEWPDEPVSDETLLTAYYEDWNRLYEGQNIYAKYDRYINERYQTRYSPVNYVVSDEDYILLSGSAGKSDERFGVEAFESGYYDWDSGEWHQNHMAVHASDPEAAKEYLTSLFGNKAVTPEEMFDSALSEKKADILGSMAAILVMLTLMCLCVFFIMRSSFLHRVREVGIYRAIGVTKKNLIFRFTVEALLLVSLTVLPAFLLSSLIIVYLSGGMLLGAVFYFPLWLAAGLLIVLYAASVFCGVLPVITLLSRTPSEILAKYDI
ncbi:MAG: ABC transporter ATP-binding protein/permease [Lachnospiraceae bacterium]|nr:ABC transporter ATP-binding protein/permease [Lachnospiraceae bacterium]